MRFGALAFGCLVFACGLQAHAQQDFVAPVRDPARAFLADAGDEAKRGTYLFYSQDYRDKRKEHVSVRGSVYGVLRDVTMNGCDLRATAEVIDLFSGTIRNAPTGEVQDKTGYAIQFRLTRDIAANMDMIDARPSQLAHSMHTQCDQDPTCRFTWLRIRSAKPNLHEQIVVNRSITFDGQASQILAPISSRDAGAGLIRDLQALAASQCQ
jgi:hypothetical protein